MTGSPGYDATALDSLIATWAPTKCSYMARLASNDPAQRLPSRRHRR
jgi:hypothetical protein